MKNIPLYDSATDQLIFEGARFDADLLRTLAQCTLPYTGPSQRIVRRDGVVRLVPGGPVALLAADAVSAGSGGGSVDDGLGTMP